MGISVTKTNLEKPFEEFNIKTLQETAQNIKRLKDKDPEKYEGIKSKFKEAAEKAGLLT